MVHLPELSVVIVSWNAREWLVKCLDSLERHPAQQSTEVIVVDNASTDGSAQAVAEQFPHCILIEADRNLGFAKGNNLGIRQASGRYVALINSDVEVFADTLPRMLAYMEAHPQVGMLGPLVLNPDSTLQKYSRPRHFPGFFRSLWNALGLNSLVCELHYYTVGPVQKVEVLGGCFWLLRNSALRAVGPLDERFFMYAEDIDWCKRLADKDWQAVHFTEARIIHYGGASSANAPIRFYLEMHRAHLQFWHKHQGWSGFAAAWVILVLHMAVRCLRAVVLGLSPERRRRAQHKWQRSRACLGWLFQVRPWRGDPRQLLGSPVLVSSTG